MGLVVPRPMLDGLGDLGVNILLDMAIEKGWLVIGDSFSEAGGGTMEDAAGTGVVVRDPGILCV